MALQFNSLLYSYTISRHTPSVPFLSDRLFPTCYNPISLPSYKLKQPKRRSLSITSNSSLQAHVAQFITAHTRSQVQSGSFLCNFRSERGRFEFICTDLFKLTYLEGNSWLWDVGGSKILVDPILVGNLDFGIPWLYDASKKFLKNFQLRDLPEISCLLITQSLDDHCHMKTLKPLSELFPNIPVVATPNAETMLSPLFRNVTYLEPGQSSEIEGVNNSKITIKATTGPILGPPWQRPENGYLIISPQAQLTLYYEPHCVYNQAFLKKEQADIVITPVIKQLLPYLTLVSGQEDAVQLAKLLNAKFIVPMKNGDLDGKGFLASIIQSEGTIESFKELLSKELPDAQVLEPTPGIPLEVCATSTNSVPSLLDA